jgi:hypothetical protein
MSVRIKDNGDAFMRALVKAAEAGLAEMALEGAEYARSRMPGSGFGYSKNKSGRLTFTAARPGAFPGVRNQRGGLKQRVFDQKIRRLSHGFGTNIKNRGFPYGLGLELGTSRMQARPWLRPTLAQHWNVMSRRFREVTRHELKRRGPRG